MKRDTFSTHTFPVSLPTFLPPGHRSISHCCCWLLPRELFGLGREGGRRPQDVHTIVHCSFSSSTQDLFAVPHASVKVLREWSWAVGSPFINPESPHSRSHRARRGCPVHSTPKAWCSARDSVSANTAPTQAREKGFPEPAAKQRGDIPSQP